MGKHTETMTRLWEVTERNDWKRLTEYFTPSSEFRMPGGTFHGAAEFQAMCEGWWSAFPDLKHEVVNQIELGDTYVCELVMIGTHTGTMRTPNGDIPATGKKIKMTSCDYVKLDKEGRIVSWHAYPDMVGMLAQLGVGG
jgi:predicted ester cyclase